MVDVSKIIKLKELRSSVVIKIQLSSSFISRYRIGKRGNQYNYKKYRHTWFKRNVWESIKVCICITIPISADLKNCITIETFQCKTSRHKNVSAPKRWRQNFPSKLSWHVKALKCLGTKASQCQNIGAKTS